MPSESLPERAFDLDDSNNEYWRPSSLASESYQTFSRELPELLKEYRDKFVAYKGSERVGIDESGIHLQDSLLSIPSDQYKIYCIEPDGEEKTELMW